VAGDEILDSSIGPAMSLQGKRKILTFFRFYILKEKEALKKTKARGYCRKKCCIYIELSVQKTNKMFSINQCSKNREVHFAIR
jgi:hypothetical protein